MENGKKIDDIEWIGSKLYEIPKDLFLKLADTKYDDGYGSPQVAQDLFIVGKDFWLARCEYDGYEWWEYLSFPNKPDKIIEAKALTIDQAVKANFDVSCGWEDLGSINGLRGDK